MHKSTIHVTKHTSRPPSDEPRIGHTRQAPFRFPLDQARARVCRTWWVDARGTFQNSRGMSGQPASAANFGACCAHHTSRPPSDEPRIGHTRQAPFRFPLDQARARVCRTWWVGARGTFQNSRGASGQPASAANFGACRSHEPPDTHQTNQTSDCHGGHLFRHVLTRRIRGYACLAEIMRFGIFRFSPRGSQGWPDDAGDDGWCMHKMEYHSNHASD